MLTCPTCHNFTPNFRSDATGAIVESCVEPAHAPYAAQADEAYRAIFRREREAELANERRAPKSKAIANLYWELTSDEYNAALEAVGLSR